MNEFEWRRQLRELRQPHLPAHDLWPAIDAALDGAAVTHPPAIGSRQRGWLLGAALAAALILAGGLGWHLQSAPSDIASPTVAKWKPSDPRLAGAAIELDAARMELELAIRQAPESPALQRLLHRTEQQQTQLRRLADRAS